MTNDLIWSPLRDELARWADAGRKPALWFRDDDAVEPTLALDRLVGLTRAHGVPVTLAVIPAATGNDLARRLASEGHTSVVVHGWSHKNHAPTSEKKQELGPDRPQITILGELRQGFEKLKPLYGEQFLPVLVPPWNRIAPSLLPHLADIGYRAISVYGPSKTRAPIARVNTHVDIMDWHGTRGGWPHADMVRLVAAEMRHRFLGAEEPIGVLSHHLVHDETAWSFLARLFEETAGKASVGWRSLSDFLS
jgi:peptidoglycan/xylan/chitin deacetylase (PgdA/CDA1 family)